MRMTQQQWDEHQRKHGFAKDIAKAFAVEPQVVSPAQERWSKGKEKELADLVVADLRRRGYIVVRSRMDKPTGQDRGVPDLIVMFGPRVACIELKAGNNKLSQAQRTYHDALMAANVPTKVAYNFDEAVSFAILTLQP